MELLEKYFETQKEIYDYFGYKEDWVVIPLSDERHMYWTIDNWSEPDEEITGRVIMQDKPLTKEILESGDFYSHSIYTQRFLPKWVYRAPEYTMICVDTHVDGNKFLCVFDNTKEMEFTDEFSQAMEEW